MKKKIITFLFSMIVICMGGCGAKEDQNVNETLVEVVPSTKEGEDTKDEEASYYTSELDLSVEGEPTIENPLIENEYVVIGDYTKLKIKKVETKEPTKEQIEQEFDSYMAVYDEEVTDELVAEKTEYKSIQEYKDAIKSQLQTSFQAQAKAAKEQETWEIVWENASIKKYNEAMVEEYILEYKTYMQEEITQMYGMSLEAYLNQQQISKEEFRTQVQSVAKSRAKQELLLEAIAKEEGLESTEDVIPFLTEKISEE